jgi:hypothetical protein
MDLQTVKAHTAEIHEMHAALAAAATEVDCQDKTGQRLLHEMLAAERGCLGRLILHQRKAGTGTLPQAATEAICAISCAVVAVLVAIGAKEEDVKVFTSAKVMWDTSALSWLCLGCVP